jgi:hypothetical protein
MEWLTDRWSSETSGIETSARFYGIPAPDPVICPAGFQVPLPEKFELARNGFLPVSIMLIKMYSIVVVCIQFLPHLLTVYYTH